jgi:hypothetical protein
MWTIKIKISRLNAAEETWIITSDWSAKSSTGVTRLRDSSGGKKQEEGK